MKPAAQAPPAQMSRSATAASASPEASRSPDRRSGPAGARPRSSRHGAEPALAAAEAAHLGGEHSAVKSGQRVSTKANSE